ATGGTLPGERGEDMVRRWGVLVACAAAVVGCDDELASEAAGARVVEATNEGPPVRELAGGLHGTIEGEPFVARGVLARRAPEDAIELRIFGRAASCTSFDDDYRLGEGEKIVTVFL